MANKKRPGNNLQRARNNLKRPTKSKTQPTMTEPTYNEQKKRREATTTSRF